MREPTYSEAVTKIWITPRLVKLGTIADVSGTVAGPNQGGALKT